MQKPSLQLYLLQLLVMLVLLVITTAINQQEIKTQPV